MGTQRREVKKSAVKSAIRGVTGLGPIFGFGGPGPGGGRGDLEVNQDLTVVFNVRAFRRVLDVLRAPLGCVYGVSIVFTMLSKYAPGRKMR